MVQRTSVRLGVLTPHVAAGPEVEFEAMAPGRVVARVERVSAASVPVSRTGGPPPAAAASVLTEPPLLDEAAERLAATAVHAIGYASTSTAYAVGFDRETAMAQRLSHRAGVPVAAACASAVMALRALGIDRVMLAHPPWFGDEVNESGRCGTYRARAWTCCR
jgi:maleate isomerase